MPWRAQERVRGIDLAGGDLLEDDGRDEEGGEVGLGVRAFPAPGEERHGAARGPAGEGGGRPAIRRVAGMMTLLMGMVESAAGSRLSGLGVQLGMLGGVVLALGALVLFLVQRNRARLVLLAGFALFAAGGSLRGLEELGVMALNYFPGWEEDVHQVLHLDHAEFEYGEDDLATDDPEPAWWEGLLWWGQRFGLVLGAGLATVGLVMEGRGCLQGSRGRSRRPGGKAGR